MKKVVIVVLLLFAIGCEKKSNSELEGVIALDEELVRQLVGLIETDKAMNRRLDELIKSDYSNVLSRLSSLETEESLGRMMRMSNKERLDNIPKLQPYDPNALQYRYLEVAEPNWVATFGDTLETRMLYNISKNRVKIAMIDKRLSDVDPNGVKQ